MCHIERSTTVDLIRIQIDKQTGLLLWFSLKINNLWILKL